MGLSLCQTEKSNVTETNHPTLRRTQKIKHNDVSSISIILVIERTIMSAEQEPDEQTRLRVSLDSLEVR
jgi:hypothetical protein